MKSPRVERIEYWLYLLFAFWARLMPRRVMLAIGSLLGRLYYLAGKRHRRLCRRNLRETLGPEYESLAPRVFAHFGRLAMDSLKIWDMSPDEIRELVQIEGAEHMADSLKRGGVLLFTAHYGNWELGATITSCLFSPVLSIARSLDNRLLEKKLVQSRQMAGNTVVEKRESARPALRALKSGGIVGILIDQRVQRSEGFVARFMDRPAYCTPAAARLAQQTGATLLPGYCEPIGSGMKYRGIYLPPIPTEVDGQKRPLEEIVQECNDVIGRVIRKRPEIWLWMHDRWRMEPPPEG